MLTIMIHATIKPNLLNDYLELIQTLIKETTRQGCITYKFNQNKQKPNEFVLYEQWENQEYLDSHIKQLFKILGPAKNDEPLPEKLLNMYEQVEPVFYDVFE